MKAALAGFFALLGIIVALCALPYVIPDSVNTGITTVWLIILVPVWFGFTAWCIYQGIKEWAEKQGDDEKKS